MEVIKCPQCSSQKLDVVSSGTFKCQECGAIFTHQTQQPTPAAFYTGNNAHVSGKSKVAAGLFALFLGGLGVHKFYLGQVGMGILYLLFCWTFIPSVIGFVEGIIYLCQSDEEFACKHG